MRKAQSLVETADERAVQFEGSKAPFRSGMRKAWRAARLRGAVAGFSSRSRRLISEHRQRRRSRDREVSDRSRRGLDWTNFFMADVQMSFGSFLAFYLAGLGWSKQDVGLALTVGAAAGVIVPIPTLPSVVMAMPFVAGGGPAPAGLATSFIVEPSNRRSALPLAPEIDIPVSPLGEPNAIAFPCTPAAS